jgi:protein required for attachment to host cells
MNETIVIVADNVTARFYRVELTDEPRAQLVETALLQHPDLPAHSMTARPPTETNTNRQAGPVHPIGAQRERHRVEHERHFARDIAQGASAATRGWNQGTVVLVADPRMLGLVREPLRKALHRDIGLKEIARDYAHLGPDDLYDHLARNGIVPAL